MTILGHLASVIGPRLDPFVDPIFHEAFIEDPLIIYDGGAAGRVFVPPRMPLCPLTRVFGFEPVTESFHRLEAHYANNPYVSVKKVALARSSGAMAFYIRRSKPTISSSLADSRRDHEAERVVIEGICLDGAPKRLGIPAADFVKLDTEGTELEILKGAKKMLSRSVLGVFVEVAFWRESAHSTVFHQIDEYLTNLGFVLFDLQINRAHFSGVGGKKDKLRSGDALYLRNFTTIANSETKTPPTLLRTMLLKLIALCIAWRYLDYALELVAFGQHRALLTSKEFSLVASRFASVKDISDWLPNFPGRSSLALFCDFLSYVLHGKARKGVPRSFNSIGNAWPPAISGKVSQSIPIRHPVLTQGEKSETKIILGGVTGPSKFGSRG